MNEMQNDDAFMQALSITRAQAGVRSMTAQEIVAYAKEVAQGYECGMTIENFNDIKELDIIEGYIDQEVERE